MTSFSYYTDEETEEALEAVVNAMIRLFGVSRGDAIGRVNKFLQTYPITEILGDIEREGFVWWAQTMHGPQHPESPHSDGR